MSGKRFNVAVAGATGAVGEVFLQILAERKFPIKNLRLLASERSVGKKLKFAGQEFPVELLSKDAFKGIDIALFSAGASRSKEFAAAAWASGAVVVDNSSAFRMEPDIPLVVPEINPEAIGQYKQRGIVANPNCTTIISIMPLKPLHDYGTLEAGRGVVVPGDLGRGGQGDGGADRADEGVRQGRADGGGGVQAPDRLQRHPAHRRLPRQRLHEGRDEDDERGAQDHGDPRPARHLHHGARAGADGPLDLDQRPVREEDHAGEGEGADREVPRAAR